MAARCREYAAKTKALLSRAIPAQLICTFVFACSHNAVFFVTLFTYSKSEKTNGAITFALILQKFRLRLSYTCAHKSRAFALSFCDTLAPIYSQLVLGQLLVFEARCK